MKPTPVLDPRQKEASLRIKLINESGRVRWNGHDQDLGKTGSVVAISDSCLTIEWDEHRGAKLAPFSYAITDTNIQPAYK